MMGELEALKAKLQELESCLIVLSENPSPDIVASGLALFLSLQAIGKSVSIVGSTPALVRDSHLVGIDRIQPELGGSNLVINFNIEEGAIDKITSASNGGQLSLTVIPKNPAHPITPSHIRFTTSGAIAELTFVIGAGSLADIGSLATEEADFFNHTTLVNLSNLSGNFGVINLTDESSSLSELTTAVLQECKLPLDQDIASNLLLGIQTATDNLQSPAMTADTFEALAILTRAGATRQAVSLQPTAQIIDNTPIYDPSVSKSTEEEVKKVEAELHALATHEDSSAKVDASPTQPEPAWLKPKIYTGASTPTN